MGVSAKSFFGYDGEGARHIAFVAQPIQMTNLTEKIFMLFVEVDFCNEGIVSSLWNNNNGVGIEARIGVRAELSFPLSDPSAEKTFGV